VLIKPLSLSLIACFYSGVRSERAVICPRAEPSRLFRVRRVIEGATARTIVCSLTLCFGWSARQAGIYTGRILKGEKPADLSVQQATKVEPFIHWRPS
jgi:hypothetical protein